MLSAQELPRRYPVTSESIVAAMGAKGLTVNGVTVSLATPISATVENPVLEVVSVTPEGERAAQLLVSCRSRLDCPSFYATARWSNAAGNSGISASPGFKRVSQSNFRAPGTTQPEGYLKIGSRTVLQLEGERIHIEMRVICLEAGGPGDKIHVSTPDRKETFEVEVVDASLTRARME